MEGEVTMETNKQKPSRGYLTVESQMEIMAAKDVVRSC